MSAPMFVDFAVLATMQILEFLSSQHFSVVMTQVHNHDSSASQFLGLGNERPFFPR